jgi:hypothetical protein
LQSLDALYSALLEQEAPVADTRGVVKT